MTENRRLRGRQLAIASGALALVAATTCAADTPRDVIVLWSANDQWVKIVPQDDPAASPNEHPAQLATEAISNALAALRVRIVDEDTGTETLRSVFTREELRNLAPRVASGLAKAGPRQDVTFSTIGSHPLAAGGLVKDVGVNAGRVFYDNGKLNVIFGELQSGYRKRNVYGQRTEDFIPRRQGSRDQGCGTKVEPRGASWRRISFECGGRSQRLGRDRRRSCRIGRSGCVAGAGGSDASSSNSSGIREGPAATKSGADLEQRLRTLKELRDKGLISEEAYRAKMQEVLSEL